MQDNSPPPPLAQIETAFRVEGALVVSCAETCRARLAAWSVTATDMTIDLGAVTQFDAFGLQLLCAARRSAAAAGIPFQLVNVPGAFTQACELAGFTPAALAPLQSRRP